MKVICKNCPIGCKLTIEDGKVFGNRCSRGLEYRTMGEKSIFYTRVKIKEAALGHLAIRSDVPVTEEEKEKLQKLISKIEIYPPIEKGQLVIFNLGGTGVSFLAQRRIL